MNTDRELLEQAAKSVGIALISWTNMYDACDEIGGRFITQPRGEPWNPLEEDGDALRLAVRLGIHITNSQSDAWATTLDVTAIEPLTNDPYTATRRAIVRAAAEVGKAMP